VEAIRAGFAPTTATGAGLMGLWLVEGPDAAAAFAAAEIAGILAAPVTIDPDTTCDDCRRTGVATPLPPGEIALSLAAHRAKLCASHRRPLGGGFHLGNGGTR
jgi:hypothetical protein